MLKRLELKTVPKALLKHPGIEYFRTLNGLAKAVGHSRGAMQGRIERGNPLLTAEEAVQLEKDTRGGLLREQLRPDLFKGMIREAR